MRLAFVFAVGTKMHHLNNKKNVIATATLFILATILVIAGTAATVLIGIINQQMQR
jgi:cell division protein ZapA (FtsZ GTPase activity inhibitor)